MSPDVDRELLKASKPWIRPYRQPWKALYLTSQLGFLLLARTPALCCMYLVPALRPNPKWTWTQSVSVALIRKLVQIMMYSGIGQSRKDVHGADIPSAQSYGKDGLGLFLEPVNVDDIGGEVKELMIRNHVQPAGVAVYWHGNGVGTHPIKPAAKDEKIIVHFHGGAYVTGDARPRGSRDPCAKLLAQAQAHPSQSISRIINVEYRLVRTYPLAEPANAFPAALLDGVAVIQYLVFDIGFHPRNIVISGDSAGGNVALSITRYLRDAPMPTSRLGNIGAPFPAHLEGVTSLMPGGMLLLSPWCDVASTHIPERVGPSCSFVRNANTDWVGQNPYSRDRPLLFPAFYGVRGLAGKAFTLDSIARNPFVAPGSLDCPVTVFDESSQTERPTFEGYPPTYISFGGKDILNDEIQLCGRRLTEQSTMKNLPMAHREMEQQQSIEWPWVVMDEEPEMWHDFVVGFVGSREGNEALERIIQWLAALPPAEEYSV
ncbi:alpha/beta-hydrolase [Clavulina sp. PMI_390]|nr:alpha/beta-hydrolase [Clavulina sp. PMI_390]